MNDYPEAFLSSTLNPVAPKPRVIGKKGKQKTKSNSLVKILEGFVENLILGLFLDQGLV